MIQIDPRLGRHRGRCQPLTGGAGRPHRSLVRPTYSRHGLDLLVRRARMELHRLCGVATPHNLCNYAPWRSLAMTTEAGRASLKQAARTAGWLLAVPALRHLRRLFDRCVSCRGVKSPLQKVDLWAMVARWPSPGRLDRVLEVAKHRAEAFLASWPGVSVAWEDLATAVMHHRRIGRVARHAACLALSRTLWARLRVSIDAQPWTKLQDVLLSAAPYRALLTEELDCYRRRYHRRYGGSRYNQIYYETCRFYYTGKADNLVGDFLLAVPAAVQEAREQAGETLASQMERFVREPAHITALRNAAAVCPPDPAVAAILADALLEDGYE